jgi:hypothetical protein
MGIRGVLWIFLRIAQKARIPRDYLFPGRSVKRPVFNQEQRSQASFTAPAFAV